VLLLFGKQQDIKNIFRNRPKNIF